jgi:glycosyltransferase involved in cell wall biosynthesis
VEWARSLLQVPDERVWYVPNFVSLPAPPADEPELILPGAPGSRIVCVANLRPEKGILNLIQAFELITGRSQQAHLLIVGSSKDREYSVSLQEEINRRGLTQKVSFLGQRADISAILRTCDIGVVSSQAEGLPLALLEYGFAGLPVVSTRVGQCGEVLENGDAGLLVPPEDPQSMSEALLLMLESSTIRNRLGNRLKERIERTYSVQAAIHSIDEIYEEILAANGR